MRYENRIEAGHSGCSHPGCQGREGCPHSGYEDDISSSRIEAGHSGCEHPGCENSSIIQILE